MTETIRLEKITDAVKPLLAKKRTHNQIRAIVARKLGIRVDDMDIRKALVILRDGGLAKGY